jgi:hypothetical protein
MASKPEDNRPEKPKAGAKDKETANRGGSLGPTKGAEKQHRPRDTDQTLDEALEESFPASDPPAQTIPRQSDTKDKSGNR